MLDFMTISTRLTKSGTEVSPKFFIKKSKDLMIRGGDFYAIWDEERKMWSTDEDDATRLIDRELKEYAEEHADRIDLSTANIKYMRDCDSGSIDKWHKYCQKQMRDNFSMLDEELIFSNTELSRDKFASKQLTYPLERGSIEAYDKLIGTLYSEEERHKLEWAIGSIVSGDSKTIQKFMVLYGAAGTGKSTILNIIQQLFEGYYTVFDAKALGSANSSFALESFTGNPLVAIQHDGDLSRIEDNTRLNSLVSHEYMTVNEKFKKSYPMRFKCFLFMGTNKPVRITDGKSGLLRRLIDVSPSGKKVSQREYTTLTKQIRFELGAIAQHCLDVYLDDPHYYDDYIPRSMMGASNDFYNFVADSFSVFSKEDGTTLKAAWEMYKNYCDEAKVSFPFSKRNFKEELKNYFEYYDDSIDDGDGTTLRNYYSGFKMDIFENDFSNRKRKTPAPKKNLIEFIETESIFDKEFANCPAQYASDKGTPMKKWDEVRTTLADIDTHKLHYVRVPENHIVIDFDIKDENGEKSYEKNVEEASKWPKTYAELSKSGAGVHLHYIYTGDVSQLSRIYDENIEIKVFSGNSSLRRALTKCNTLPIATLNSGLPLKEVKSVINFDGIKNEKGLRTLIKKHLNKEIMGATKPSIDMIYKCLEEAYEEGYGYDVSDMKNAIFAFAAGSTNQADTCLKLVSKMKFKSKEPTEGHNGDDDSDYVFYDVEVFPNLFLVNYKFAGEGKPVVRLINPKPSNVETLLKFKLIGFNCRRYDNHMLYACLMGYTNEQLYHLSQRIVKSKKGEANTGMFGEAYNLSYTDVYDFASAGNKKSLKKLEIEMGKLSEASLKKKGFSEKEIRLIKAGTHHKELGLPWDEPVPEEKWNQVAEYCDNDVIATEAAFTYLKGDWTARQILADISGMTVNDTTNSLSTRIIFGTNKNPQNEFNYRNLAEPVGSDQYEEYLEKFGEDHVFRVFDDEGLPLYRDYIPGEKLPKGYSILPFFKGYKFENGKSTYMGEEIGEGGKVYGEPGMYFNVWDGDVTGQHPSSIIAEMLFGPRYTNAYKEIVDGRVSIKHQAWNMIDELFGGKLKPYIQKVIDGELTVKDLANALKTVINAIYGLTSAKFSNPFRDPRNKDNIVAKRGALFMTLLKAEVQKRGYKVCHIKTDSIKIPNATQEIKDFVIKFGKEFGYSFETEAEFEKYCLVNNAVYIAKTRDGEWTATGKQFAIPYVFKTLFSKEPITMDDMREVFETKTALYLDMNEKLPDVSAYENELEKLEDKYKKGKLSDTLFESEGVRLTEQIEKGHEYKFIGKVGEFCPVKPGKGGGVLYWKKDDKYNAAPGTTGYRWLESEMMMAPGNEENIDRSYYNKLVDDAVETISQYGDFEMFVSDDPIPEEDTLEPDFMNIPETNLDELPFPEFCKAIGFA